MFPKKLQAVCPKSCWEGEKQKEKEKEKEKERQSQSVMRSSANAIKRETWYVTLH